MNGPAHYRKAEELLGQIEHNRGWSAETEISVGLQALAHATLAHTAAAAVGNMVIEAPQWRDAAGTKLSST